MPESHERGRYWEQRYHEGRTGWDRGDASPSLRHWLGSDILPEGRVLVPGCGHGHEIVELARRGHRVTAVDIAAPPVERLRARLEQFGLAADVVQADLLHWQPDALFDAIYEQTCLCAIDPMHWGDYAARLGRWLRPGGLLLANFMQTGRGGGPPFDCPMPRMRELFSDDRWQWPAEAPRRVPHSDGLFELAVVLQRRADG